MSGTRDEKTLATFGNHLNLIRRQKKISLRKLEVLSEVDYSEIHRIEKGLRNPSLTTILALADALQISVCELISFR